MAELVRTLLVRDPSGTERLIALDRDVLTIGRDTSCAIRLESLYVSRQHARIELRERGPTLVDLGSVNGSLLNGVRVEGSAVLTPGDIITIADVSIECLAEAVTDGTTRAMPRDRIRPGMSETTLPPIAEPAGGAPPPPDLLRVDVQAYEVWIGDKQLDRRLSAQEFELLRMLYENRNRVCTRQELGDTIWGAGNWDPNMLHRLVYRLKEKLEPNPEKPRYVQTVPWVGYRVIP